VNSSRHHEPAIDVIDEPRTRREMLRTGGVAAIAGVLGVLGVATATTAKNGAAVRAGAKNSATQTTTLVSTKGPALEARLGGGGKAAALRGTATSSKGVAVQGAASSGKGKTVAVQGVSQSPNGTAGLFVANKGGTAIDARSPDRKGVALRTRGRLQLTERSGDASVSGGAEFVIPVAGGLTEKSLVLATLQDHFPGVHVESASVLDAEDGLIVVRLSQAVAEPARVAWIVLD